MRTEIEAQIGHMSSRPLRCLLMAFKDVSSDEVTALLNKTLNFIDIESDLILVGVTGLVDPPRPDGKYCNVFVHLQTQYGCQIDPDYIDFSVHKLIRM